MSGDRLREVLGAPELGWIIEKARWRLERGQPLRGAVVRRREPAAAERAAVERLLGRVMRGAVLSVSLDELDRLLRDAEICAGLEAAVAALAGPAWDRRAEAARIEAAFRAIFEEAAAACDGRPEVVAWLDDLRATGLVRRLSCGDVEVARRHMQQGVEVVRRLPAEGIPLAELAASATGDSHALDAGAPLGALVFRFAAALSGVARCERAAERRDVWDQAGVLLDELSAPVLVLNLGAAPDSLAGRVLAMHAAAGEPCRLAVRQLRRAPPRFDLSGQEVFVCENPAILAAAADHLGPRGAPLVCVEGQVRTAARLLLERLRGAGATLRYHGDFDWGGVRIGNVVMGRHGALPWRYGAADYREAPKGAELAGAPVAAAWDEALGAAMREDGRAVHEEGVVEALLADLRAAGAR
ncbi:TIGR02679 family protein [Sorangium sp. So ce861]|uniref:TIGR02679 family protein n=1 Tax=Sorangium sp. So ce861 TaxID=3133323 RepID=UPI003F636727